MILQCFHAMLRQLRLHIKRIQRANYILRSGDTYPQVVQSSRPEATVIMTSVTVIANNNIAYENFTLSINIQNLNLILLEITLAVEYSYKEVVLLK